MSFGSSTSSAVELAQRRLREVLVELRSAAEKELDVREYYRRWLTTLSEAMAAVSGCCLLLQPDGRWEAVAAVGSVPAGDESAQQHLGAMLQELQRTLRPVLEVGPTVTMVYYPLLAAGALRGAVRFDLDIETEAAQQGCLKFIGEAAESVERFHLLDDRRTAQQQVVSVADERRLSAAVHAAIDLTSTSFALANEGRLLVGCDRLSVLIRRGSGYRVVAVSGQDAVNRRTSAVQSLEDLVRRAAATGDVLVFPDGEAELDADLTQILETYVDSSHVKRLLIVPLVERSQAERAETEPAKIIGAVVCEYFGETLPQTDERRRIDVLARCGSAALRNACEYDGLFLLFVWRTLGRWRRACFEPGTRRRTWFIIGSVAASVAALATVPADFTAYCRGTLNPVERRRVFAPLDGTVERIAVKHGDRVARGQTLVELRNTDLDIAEADVEGRRTASAEQLAAVERALFDEAKRLTAEERARLSGERSQLREQLASLDRQLELYADKRRQLTVVSPIDGEVTTWSADDLLENRPVRQGQQLLTIAAVGGPWELELRVPDDRSGRVVEAARTASEPLRVTYSPAVSPGVIHEGRVVEIHNSAELLGEDGNTVLVRTTVDAAELPQRRPGAEAAAHIHCGRRAVGYVWLCDVYGFLRSRVLFRWF